MKRDAGDKPETAARRAAMNLLARREHGFHELLDKLAERLPEIEPEICHAAVSRLRDQGLQSDSRFVENFVRYRAARGVGPLKIKAELLPRRLDNALVRAALYNEAQDWDGRCREVLHKRFGSAPVTSAPERARQQRFLLQRGFTQDQIRHALRAHEDD